jgi:DNA-binding NtrC family response regulator
MAHLLIIDDELSTSWALAEGLSDDGFTIDTFRSAEEALEWLKRGGRSELVISDLRLPGMSGLDLAKKLARGRHAQPVIVVTAYGSYELARDLSRAGVVECFSKPFAMDALRRAVRRALAASARTRGSRRAPPALRTNAATRAARTARTSARRKAA